ncbi:11904_t:CDS:2 [Ambispora leptoticha]|uniref:11904_t:CDS:1 n=1 Tax=Ambispora leptoticha TaxID=144679 RepID=A0A9N9GFS6_9GLOM|nr:11904_t:CDS:2 [Ambispora leptoticha]
MPAKLPLFKTITSSGFNADTKLYSGKEYTRLSHDLHLYAETKQEYTKKVVRILKKWQEHARAFRLLNQTELSQLSRPFSDVCLDVVDKLKKEIKEGRITDDKNQPDNPDALCGDCSQRYQAAQDHNDFQPCGCLNVKSSDLLEITSENLVKSFFVICEIGSIKKQPQSIFSIHYLNGRIKLVNSNQDCKLYEDLVTYFQPLPNYKIVTRKDLGLKEQDNPDDHTD